MDASVLSWRRTGREGDDMQNLSERQRIEIALIWACALLLIYLFALAPLLTAERTAALVQRDRSRAQLARVEEYQHTLLSDGQAEEKLRVRMARAAAALPNESGQGAFVHRAEQLARRSGVTIEGIVLHAPREEEEIVIRPVELKFYGGYFQILDFLRAVQEDERAVQFGSFVLTTQAHELHCTLTVNVASLHGENDEEQLPPVRRGDRGE